MKLCQEAMEQDPTEMARAQGAETETAVMETEADHPAREQPHLLM